MLSQGKVGVGLEVLRQPLSQSLTLQRRSAGDLVSIDIPRLTPPFQPAFYALEGDSEEIGYFLSGDAPIDSGKHLQSQVLRVSVHEGHFMQVRYLCKSLLEAYETGQKGLISLRCANDICA